ncbi:MAG: hypothetical protein JWO40_584 [Candidatus Doudnabacteria bacterium]|nr:hypothetical protein [Candidatus Doudnabacteria bacterium]
MPSDLEILEAYPFPDPNTPEGQEEIRRAEQQARKEYAPIRRGVELSRHAPHSQEPIGPSRRRRHP